MKISKINCAGNFRYAHANSKKATNNYNKNNGQQINFGSFDRNSTFFRLLRDGCVSAFYNPKNTQTTIRQNGDVTTVKTVALDYETITKTDKEQGIVYKYHLDKKTGNSVEYTKDTQNSRSITTNFSNGRITSKTINSFGYDFQDDFEYDSEGKEKSHKITYFTQDGSIKSVLTLYPNTGKLKDVKKYRGDKIIEDFYGFNINERTNTVVYDAETKDVSEEYTYYNDGKSLSSALLHNPDGRTMEYDFDFEGNPTFFRVVDANGLLNTTREYYEGTSTISRETILFHNLGYKTVKDYNKEGRIERKIKTPLEDKDFNKIKF